MRHPCRAIGRWMSSHKAIAIIAATAIIVGGYALWSAMSWQQYQGRYEKSLADAKISIDTTLALSQTTIEEKNQKMAALAEMANKEPAMNCQMTVVFDWQRVFDNVQTRVSDCNDKAEKLSTLNDAIKAIAIYLQDEQALAGKMSVAAAPDQVKEGDFEAQVANWQQIRNDVALLTVGEMFAPVKTKAQEAANTIHDAWQRLLDAHKAQDQLAYEEARTKLPESYDRLAAIVTVADSQMVELTKALLIAYKELSS